jgi:dUTP pyrophosphatase
MSSLNTLLVKRLSDTAGLPTNGHHDDCGLDLYCSQAVTIAPGAWADVPTDVAVKLPPNTWGMLTGRSSAVRTHGLMVLQGVIDEGYTGELYACVYNIKTEPVEVEVGQRLAQLILMHNVRMDISVQEVDELPETTRGAKGFGSTGI